MAEGKSYGEVKREMVAAHGQDAFESRKGTIARRVAREAPESADKSIRYTVLCFLRARFMLFCLTLS